MDAVSIWVRDGIVKEKKSTIDSCLPNYRCGFSETIIQKKKTCGPKLFFIIKLLGFVPFWK